MPTHDAEGAVRRYLIFLQDPESLRDDDAIARAQGADVTIVLTEGWRVSHDRSSAFQVTQSCARCLVLSSGSAVDRSNDELIRHTEVVVRTRTGRA